jgi:sigma-B regulation protein RsbU (phosphoserine phosphatase)
MTTTVPIDIYDRATPWDVRLAIIIDLMREMSRQTDPQAMSRVYGQRMRQLLPTDRSMSLSRRELDRPAYRITRSSLWKEEINPWREPERLPLFTSGLLGDLLYAGEPVIVDELEVNPADPAFEYLDGMRSLVAMPHYDRGEALNMVVQLSRQPGYFQRERLPDFVWMGNLFGRATHTLVMKNQVKQAYLELDAQFKQVADIQRSLLPQELPAIPNLDLAVHYQTSQHAGGDYYDFFQLPQGRWGILIADVSGHGTPAAVLMAVTHSIAHAYNGTPTRPGELLGHINRSLAARYTLAGTFVTAFYGVYDPARRSLTYANAGHNQPRLKRCSDGSRVVLDGVGGLPLGILAEEEYPENTIEMVPGDQVVFYTDGLTEAMNKADEQFGSARLDGVLEQCALAADGLLREVLAAVDAFAEGRPPADDRTLLIAKVR